MCNLRFFGYTDLGRFGKLFILRLPYFIHHCQILKDRSFKFNPSSLHNIFLFLTSVRVEMYYFNTKRVFDQFISVVSNCLVSTK